MDDEVNLAGDDDECMENCTADDYLNATINANIKVFITPACSGATTSIAPATKNSIITACTYQYN